MTTDKCDRRSIPAGASEGWWSARDGVQIRRIDWAQSDRAARGKLLFLPGRGDFYEKYLETLDHWHRRGWSVTALDWRGQGPSANIALAQDPFSQWIEDLATFFDEWAATGTGPEVIVAHSMGGHILLRALAERALAPDAVVLSSPMLGLQPQWVPRKLLHLMIKAMVALRGAGRFAWDGDERPYQAPADRIKLLTHDEERYADEAWWRESRPQLAMEPPRWGWIERAFASSALLESPGALEHVETPALILSAQHDALVSHRAIERAAARLARAQLITFGPEARHELLREVDAVRERVLRAIDSFLDGIAPVSS